MAEQIWLIGMMGSGKSTVARRLATRLELDWLDLDDVIAQRVGSSIARFWEQRGEDAFRDVEIEAVREVAGKSGQVIATGGGTVLRPDSVTMMRASGLVVWLQATPESLDQRLESDRKRPLLNRPTVKEGGRLATLRELLAARRPLYAAAAHASVATDGISVDTVVQRIEELWTEFE